MRTGDKAIFNKEKTLAKMLEMRREGWSYIALGLFFGVDHSTIYYECVKHKVKKDKNIPFSITVFLERTQKPKSYADYLRLSQVQKLTTNLK